MSLPDPYDSGHISFCVSGSYETNFKTKITPLRSL